MTEYIANYPNAFDCKHSKEVVSVTMRQRLSSIIIDIAKTKMVKPSEQCPFYSNRLFKGGVPLDYCQNYCKAYEKGGGDKLPAKGLRVLPMGECDNFDYQTGCKGHPEEGENE